jgi:hypothetical protein
MRIRGLNIVLSLFILLCISVLAFAQEAMTNDEVISLTKAGLAPSIIIGKIRTSRPGFDLSTNSLISLKQAGVSDEVVTAMLEATSGRPRTVGPVDAAAGDPNDPSARHSHGIYLFERVGERRVMTQMRPIVSAQNRVGGVFTNSITYGISKIKQKANLPGRNADLQVTNTRPVFYFYLDNTSGGLNTASGIPSDPNEFMLVHFNIRSDNREVTISKQNAFGGKGGLSDEYVVPFEAESLGNGVFKITPSRDLKKGEYGFYLVNSGNSNANAAIGAKFFDFGVNPIP